MQENEPIDINYIIESLKGASILKGNSKSLKGDIVNNIGGAKGGKKNAQTPTDMLDNLFSESCICVTDLICEGPIAGVFIPSGSLSWSTNDQLLRSTYLNGIPVINDDNTINYFSYTSYLSNGTQDSAQGIVARVVDIQQPVLYSIQTSVVPPQGGALKLLLPGVSHSILSPYVNQLIIGLRVPQLYSIDSSNGNTSGNSVTFSIYVDGVVVYQGSISGKTTTGYVKQFVINLPPASSAVQATLSPRICIIQKTNPDSVSSSDIQSLIVDYIVEVGTDALIYPNSVMARSKFSSRYFTSTPNRQYDLLGLEVSIPDNYTPFDPTTNTPASYDGNWDGNFQSAQWTNNPAWCLYDLLTNTRYGLGNYIDPAQIDKWALYQIGQYCDEPLSIIYPDGTTGVEPRFSCNVKVDTRDEAFKVILNFCSNFRSLCFWDGQTLSFSQDSPKDPLMQFNNSNITNEGFSYTDIDKNSIYTVALVGYYDQNDFFQKHVVYVSNPDGIIQWGIREIEIDAFACTSRTQAYRLGMWALYSSLYEREIVNFKTGMDILYCKPGDIIQVMDSDRLQDRRGGRVQQVTFDYTNTQNPLFYVTLDAPIYIDPTYSGYLSISCPQNMLSGQTSSAQIEFPQAITTTNILYGSVSGLNFEISTSGYYQTIPLNPFPYISGNISGAPPPGFYTSGAMFQVTGTFADFDFGVKTVYNTEDYTWILNTSGADPNKYYYANQSAYNAFVLGYLNQQASYLQQVDVNGYNPALYRILSIKDDGNGIYEITALQYNPDKYALIENNGEPNVNIVVPPSGIGSNGGLTSVGPLQLVSSTNSQGVSTVTVSWQQPAGFSPITMGYNVSYTYNSNTYNTTTTTPYFSVGNISTPNTTVTFTVYPFFNNNPGMTPNPNIVSMGSITTANQSLNSLSITNFEIVGQGTNTVNTTPDVDTDWGVNNNEALSLLSNFQMNVYNGNNSNFLRTANISPTSASASLFSYDYSFADNTADCSGQPSRAINFILEAISVYGSGVASATLSTTNPAPPAIYPNNGYTLAAVSQGFTVTMNSNYTGAPIDFDGFLVYYWTGYFVPTGAINPSGYFPNTGNSGIQVLNVAGPTASTATISLPAGTTYYGCVVAYDTFGLYSLNLPNTVFSGVIGYGVASGTPSIPNGFTISSVVETDSNNNSQVYLKMNWNPNPETNIDAYHIQIQTTGLNTRYYSADESSTSLYVPFPPGLNVTGFISAVNTQGNYSPYASGFGSTPTIIQPGIKTGISPLTSGTSTAFILFPTGLNHIPIVVGNLTALNPISTISWVTSGISTSGFNLLLGSPIPNSGYQFEYMYS